MPRRQAVAKADEGMTAPFVEFGATGLRQFSGYVREDFLRELVGWRGMRVLREMRDNDAIIGAIFFAIEMLLRGVEFRVEPVGGGGAQSVPSPENIEAAAFVNSCLADMEIPFPDFLAQVLSFLQFGWYAPEIVYKKRSGQTGDPKSNSRYSDGMIGWRKFAPRAQETMLHWEFDESGDATAFVQLLPTGGPLLRVPLAKCLHFKTVAFKNNPEGRSILRSAYVSWFYRKRIQEIEAIGIERDLAGIPCAWVPAKIMGTDATDGEKAQLESFKKMVRDTSRNEQEGFVFPLAYDANGNPIYKFELLRAAGQRQFDTNKIIDRYDHRILATVMADFIVLGSQGRGQGSYAQSKNKTDMFSVAVVAFLDIICAEFNRKAIPDLLKLNSMAGECRMVHGDISRRDLEELGQYVLSIAQAGALVPDAGLEDHLREEGGLPASPGGTDNNLNQGGNATEDADEGATTATGDPKQGQGRSQNGGASDGTYDPDGGDD